tara:strand:- start:129 stop:506 length:378 start_codon:yes stop_codon:yes gene_type:complete
MQITKLLTFSWIFSLFLVGPAIANDVYISGIYKSYGLNPNGTDYSGEVCIEQSVSGIFMTWSFNGDTSYSGNGQILGQVVSVDWKAEFPVFYVIMADGELHGTWNDGTAVEKLSPVEKNKNQTCG